MIDIPPETVIKSTIRFGSVYYFPEESFHSSEPHYFIVININPLDDGVLFLVCSSSKIEKVKERRKICPRETLIEIGPGQYKGFRLDSIIDCNYVLETSIRQLVDKLSRKELSLKPEMDLEMVEALRKGVLVSPLIENRIKDILKK